MMMMLRLLLLVMLLLFLLLLLHVAPFGGRGWFSGCNGRRCIAVIVFVVVVVVVVSLLALLLLISFALQLFRVGTAAVLDSAMERIGFEVSVHLVGRTACEHALRVAHILTHSIGGACTSAKGFRKHKDFD